MKYNEWPVDRFDDLRGDDEFAEITLRIVGWNGDDYHPSGSAVVIAGNLALTARHVIDDYASRYGASAISSRMEIDCSMWLIQIKGPGPNYLVWEPRSVWCSPHSDLALIHLKPHNDLAAAHGAWRLPLLDFNPPRVGTRVAALGVRDSVARLGRNANGTRHLEVNGTLTVTTGEVREVHHVRRDVVRAPFPCLHVNARFDASMSGGPVFSENGALCGVISSTYPPFGEGEEHASYVATLWPLLAMRIDVGRGDQFPRNVDYPVIDLYRDRILNGVGWERVVISEDGRTVTYHD